MDRKSMRACGVVVVLVLMMLAEQATAEGIYACYGGCYNQCIILRRGKSSSERLPCYWNCLRNCISHYPEDYKYYCQLGCSLALCPKFSSDGKKMEKCLGGCSNTCKT